MVVPFRCFSASGDSDAAGILGGHPGSVAETTVRDGFLPSSVMAEWESVLTGRGAEGHARVVADDGSRSGSKIFAVSPELRAALVAADRERLTGAAHRWVDQCGPRYGRFDPDDVSMVFGEMSGLARSADAERAGMYFWMR